MQKTNNDRRAIDHRRRLLPAPSNPKRASFPYWVPVSPHPGRVLLRNCLKFFRLALLHPEPQTREIETEQKEGYPPHPVRFFPTNLFHNRFPRTERRKTSRGRRHSPRLAQRFPANNQASWLSQLEA
jgi:hypothetical protein